MTENVLHKTGQIQIHTENILPIIKKWLYSEHDIFLRELVSNSMDAISKLSTIAGRETVEGVQAPLVSITTNSEAKTLTISDTGLGLDAEEMEKYIAQVAFSSAEEFLSKYKDKEDGAQIIGHFGLGFYSAFMVASTVEVISKSYKSEAPAVKWTCEGSVSYTVDAAEREAIGTDVVLHLNGESLEYLNESKVIDLVKKYANFMPVDIQVNGNTVNEKNPLWVQQPNGVTEEQYKSFYQTLFPFNQEPLFWIHLNVDYPFKLQGILYFPKLTHEFEAHKGQVKLFCKQVFVSDDAKEVIPEFLTLLQGAIDCPDMPLNVSRSYLQNDPYVQKISKHIVKKVADKLTELFQKDRPNFEKYWADIHPFVKYGMMNHDEFYDKVKECLIFESSNGGFVSLPEYLERNKSKSENKVIYCTNRNAQATYVGLCKEQGLEVLFLETLIDSHFIQFMEMKNADVKYVAVDSELSDLLVSDTQEAQVVDADNKTADDHFAELVKTQLGIDKLKVEVKSLKSDTLSGMMLESEMSKRLRSMSHMMRGAMPGDMFSDATLVVNRNNPLVKRLQTMAQSNENPGLVKDLSQHIYDLARLSQKQLSGEEMQAFILRSNRLLS